jgi:hypothetical protein
LAEFVAADLNPFDAMTSLNMVMVGQVSETTSTPESLRTWASPDLSQLSQMLLAANNQKATPGLTFRPERSFATAMVSS